MDSLNTAPEDRRCPSCGESAVAGLITCGQVSCVERYLDELAEKIIEQFGLVEDDHGKR